MLAVSCWESVPARQTGPRPDGAGLGLEAGDRGARSREQRAGNCRKRRRPGSCAATRGMARAIHGQRIAGTRRLRIPRAPPYATTRARVAFLRQSRRISASVRRKNASRCARDPAHFGAWRRHEGDGPVSDGLYRLARAAAVVFVLRVAERAGCFIATPSAVLDDVRRALLTRALR
jgi:hypothetical protein